MDTLAIRQAIADLSIEVRNFHKNRNGKSWSYSCVVCGDSRTNKRKARFGIAIKDGTAVCNCFNCGYSSSFIYYLKDYHPNIYERYMVDSFVAQKPVMYDIDHLVESGVSDRSLASIFYIVKHRNPKVWLQHLANKKISLKENNLRKLYNIHKKYHTGN